MTGDHDVSGLSAGSSNLKATGTTDARLGPP